MPAAGHGDEIVGSAAQLGADVLDDQVEIAVRLDDAGEDLARDRFFGGEDHGLDPPHPLAPAQLRRQRVEGLGSRGDAADLHDLCRMGPMESKSAEAEGRSARELPHRADGDQTFKQPAAAAVGGARAGGRHLDVLGQQNRDSAGGVAPPQCWRDS
jgi:hypothetical protein